MHRERRHFENEIEIFPDDDKVQKSNVKSKSSTFSTGERERIGAMTEYDDINICNNQENIIINNKGGAVTVRSKDNETKTRIETKIHTNRNHRQGIRSRIRGRWLGSAGRPVTGSTRTPGLAYSRSVAHRRTPERARIGNATATRTWPPSNRMPARIQTKI